MRELTNKKIKCQEISFTTHGSKTISILNSRSLLPLEISEFCNTSHIKHKKLTDKLSVKLRVFYSSLLGEKKYDK